MSTYAQLKSEIEGLQARAEEALRVEKSAAIAQIQALIAQFGISAGDIGLEKKRAGRPPKARADAVADAS
ncbi:MAG TPA: H-NS family nucleoid-associated regulatory protein [Burkholderiaceae bacterium]|nr:H-NS family nucleoid-associated regulatory protein [Burkholderiaceae bacterium]